MPRPRSERAHRQVLSAAARLFADHGIESTSMDAIAEKSGVSKATIYKHWADKEALLLETMSHLSGLKDRPVFDSGDTRRDLIAVLSHKPPTERNPLLDRISPHLIAYAARNPEFGRTWRATVMEPPRRDVTLVLKRGIERGEIELDLNFETALAELLGPMLYVHIFRKHVESKDAPNTFAEQIVNAFWRAHAGRRPRKARIH